MASIINALSTGSGGVVTTADASGILQLQSNGTTAATVNGSIFSLATALATSSGGTGLSSYTANGVVYASSTSVLTTGSALTFDGTNLGIGLATPSGYGISPRAYVQQAADSGWKGLVIASAGSDAFIGVYYDGSVFNYSASYGSSAGYKPQAWQVGGSEQMRLTSTGLGIGTTAPGFPLSLRSGAGVACYAEMAGNNQVATSLLVGQDAAGLSRIFQNGAYPITFWTNYSEQMRLDSSGNLLVGTTSFASSNSNSILMSAAFGAGYWQHASGTASGATYHQFNYNGTQIGSITQAGTTGVLYNVTSDQRLKTDLGTVTSTDVIANTVIHDFTWKSDGSQARGVFAQEAAKVLPAAVKVGDDGEEVTDQWQVDYSKYVPDLIVDNQNLRSLLKELKQEIDLLKQEISKSNG